jgi:translation initiation factor IF-2
VISSKSPLLRASVDIIADLQITNNKSDIHRTKALKRFGLIVDNENTESRSKDGNDTSLSVADDIIRIPVIIKSDAHGTLHAIESALLGIASPSKHSMLIDPIRYDVGPINSSDIVLAWKVMHRFLHLMFRRTKVLRRKELLSKKGILFTI